MKAEITFTHDKTTKRTHRFTADEGEVVGSIYIKKTTMPEPVEKVKVMVETLKLKREDY